MVILQRKESTFNTSTQFEFIDLLLGLDIIIPETAVLDAIDYGNFTALSRILERRDGRLDFDPNTAFEDSRFEYMARGSEEISCYPRQTCVSYASFHRKTPFVDLLKKYGWSDVPQLAVARSNQPEPDPRSQIARFRKTFFQTASVMAKRM